MRTVAYAEAAPSSSVARVIVAQPPALYEERV
jgi:hypothetical protein